jgi:hypothetical protein
MVKKSTENSPIKQYKKTGVIAAVAVIVAVLGVWAVSALNSEKTTPVSAVIEEVSENAANGANLRIAVVRMDAIQAESKVLKNLREQKEKYENK